MANTAEDEIAITITSIHANFFLGTKIAEIPTTAPSTKYFTALLIYSGKLLVSKGAEASLINLLLLSIYLIRSSANPAGAPK